MDFYQRALNALGDTVGVDLIHAPKNVSGFTY